MGDGRGSDRERSLGIGERVWLRGSRYVGTVVSRSDEWFYVRWDGDLRERGPYMDHDLVVMP